jgi:hypothetical protein
MRMKNHMVNHVQLQKIAMFAAACQTVQDSLEQIWTEVGQSMQAAIHLVFAALHRDYKSLLGGDSSIDALMQKWERDMRAETGRVLEDSETMFKGIVGDDNAVEQTGDADSVLGDVTAEEQQAREGLMTNDMSWTVPEVAS